MILEHICTAMGISTREGKTSDAGEWRQPYKVLGRGQESVSGAQVTGALAIDLQRVGVWLAPGHRATGEGRLASW